MVLCATSTSPAELKYSWLCRLEDAPEANFSFRVRVFAGAGVGVVSLFWWFLCVFCAVVGVLLV